MSRKTLKHTHTHNHTKLVPLLDLESTSWLSLGHDYMNVEYKQADSRMWRFIVGHCRAAPGPRVAIGARPTHPLTTNLRRGAGVRGVGSGRSGGEKKGLG